MNNEEGKIWYGLGIDNTGLQADARKSSAVFRGIGDNATSDLRRIDTGVNMLGVSIAGALSGASIISFGRSLIDITGKFQVFEAVLTNTLNSPEKAKASMNMLSEFAATTPFQVDALTGSFVKLANQGFVPTISQMVKLGDLSSSVGKGFDQLAEALIDAQVGEMERLKEFGIRASKEGDKVTFTFKEQATQVDNTASAIREYILSLGELQGVQGSNAAISATLTGQVSNLEDLITQKMNELGQSSDGFLSGAISGSAYLVANYEKIGRVLGVLVGAYGAYKAALIAIAAYQKAMALIQTIEQFNQMSIALRRTTQAQILLNKVVGANPYIKLASILMTVGGLMWAFAKNNSTAEDKVRGLNKALDEAGEEFDKEASKIKALEDIVKNGNVAYDERKRALNELQKIIPNYNAELTTEGVLTNNNTDAIKQYLVQLERQIKMKAAQEELEEAYRQKRKQEKELVQHKEELSSAESYNSVVARPMVSSKIGTSGMQVISMGAGSGTAKPTAGLKHSIKEINEELSKTNTIINELNIEIEDASQSTGTTVIVKSYSEQVQEAALSIAKLKEELNSLQAGNGESPDFAKDISNKKKELTEAEQRYNLLLGIDKKYIKDKQQTLAEAERNANAMQQKASNSLLDEELSLKRKQITDKIKLIEFERDNTIRVIEEEKQAYIALMLAKNPKLKVSDIDTSVYDKRVTVANKTGELGKTANSKEEKLHNEEILKEFASFKDRYKALADEHEKNKADISKAEGNADNQAVADEKYQEDLATLNEEVLNSIDGFEALANEITDANVNKIIDLLVKAKAAMTAEGKGDNSKEVKAVDAEIKKLQNRKPDVSPSKRSLKEWQDMEEQLNDCIGSFEEMGDAVGGVAGEIISTAGGIVTSTVSMVSSIAQLVNISINGTMAAAAGASAAIRAVETASIILAVISAVIQVATKIAQMFNKDEDYQEQIERLQGEIDNLEWELQNRDIVKMREKDIDLLTQVRDVLKETTSEVVKQYREAGKLSNIWKYHSMSAQMSAEIQSKSAIELAKIYANISYSDSNIFGTEQYSDATEQLKNLVQQQLHVQEQINNEGKKKKSDDGQISDWEIQIQELGAEAVHLINEVFEGIMGGSAIDWANELGNALFDAAQKGEDGMIAWGEATKGIVGDIMRQLMIQEILMPEIMKIFDSYKSKWFKDNKFVGFDAIMGDMPGLFDELNGLYGGFSGSLDGLSDELKEILGFGDADADRTASQSGIATASQDSVDENNGRLTAIQGHTYNISEKANIIADYTERLVRSNEVILDRLSGIETNTAFCRHLEAIQKDMEEVRNNIENIDLRGIKIKK